MQRNKYASSMFSGFTIIELMITVAIIAILGVTASSLYTSYTQRSNREMAKIQLQQDASFMEQYYSQRGAYFDLNSNSWPANSVESYIYGASGAVYAVSFVPSQPTSSNKEAFSIIATPISDTIQSGDPSGRLCINQSGTLVENAGPNCGIAAISSTATRAPFCTSGTTYLPCSGGCDNGGPYSTCSGSCIGAKICGTPTTPGCAGFCQGAIVEGPCSGDCTGATIYVAPGTGPCSGTCENTTVIRTTW